MKKDLGKTGGADPGRVISIMVTIVCSVAVTVFLGFYFFAYQSPYMRQGVLDLSEGWRYETPGGEQPGLRSLTSGIRLSENETLTLLKTLDIDLPEAAVVIRTDHQSLRVFLDGVLLCADAPAADGENPGIAQRIVALPEDYLGKTLAIELTSPYRDFSGRTGPVLMGERSSLETYIHDESLRPLLLMAVCFVVWTPIAVVGFSRGKSGAFNKERLAIGVFAVVWGLYFIVSQYDVLTFLGPVGRSVFSTAMYFLLPVPLSFYFYFSFEHYEKWVLPAAAFRSVFAAAALFLQLLGLVDLPRIIILNDIVLSSVIYEIILSVMEARRRNRDVKLAVPFLLIAYGFMIYCYHVFYTERNSGSYYYRDFYFLLVLAVLVYSIWHFFRDIYRQAKENEMLSAQERQMRDSYENFRTHQRETARLKHDMLNHFIAMRTYLDHGRTEEARAYLTRYAGQSAAVIEAAYSEHFLMNAVVSSLYRQAEELGIKVTANLHAVPLHIPDPDLYSLFSNLTDNAVEACVSVPEGRPRFIDLAVTKREPYFSIRCENSKAGGIVSEDGKILTTKSGDGHGYGLGIIRRIVESYDGMMNVEHDENTFTVTLALKDR